jgi:SAM-dependent methyltransferase
MPTFLHVGAGLKHKDKTTAGFNRPEWAEVRLDISAFGKPDILADMTDMAPVASGSMDAIFSSHNIEHLFPHDVPKALAEFRRVLKPTGFAVVTCPDIQMAAAAVAEGRLTEPLYMSPAGPIRPFDIIYGHAASIAAGHPGMAHRTGFTLNSLVQALLNAGFARVSGRRRRAHFELWAVASMAELPDAELQALVDAHVPP